MDADVIVIGGGSAGLQAALTLGRMRFDVVVIDEGRPSNAPAHAIGGLLGAHDLAPVDLLAKGREQLAELPSVRIVGGSATRLDGLAVEPLERAVLARRCENAFVGAPTGLMDQAASTLCTADHALFFDCRTLEAAQVALDLGDAGLELLVLDTNTPHTHVDGEYADRRATCEEAAALLGVFGALAIAFFVFFYPVLTASPLSRQGLEVRQWFDDCRAPPGALAPDGWCWR